VDELGLPKAERREPVSVELTRHLLDYLLSGQFKPGQRIPSERQLAEAMSVGRSAVRDALRPLAAFGLLDVRVGDGTYLSDPNTDLLPRLIEWGMLLNERSVVDLIEVRWHFEVVTARLAAERRSELDVADLRHKLAELAAAKTPDTFSRADTAFHLRIAEASGNTVLAGMLHRIQTLLRVWVLRIQTTHPQLESTYREHLPIMEAIAAGDGDAAAEAMAVHLTGATERLKATLNDEHPEPAIGLTPS
jgi:GntR family transcriptional regulator, transcriptional repressor for pyruvate dehydrogenase complex